MELAFRDHRAAEAMLSLAPWGLSQEGSAQFFYTGRHQESAAIIKILFLIWNILFSSYFYKRVKTPMCTLQTKIGVKIRTRSPSKLRSYTSVSKTANGMLAQELRFLETEFLLDALG